MISRFLTGATVEFSGNRKYGDGTKEGSCEDVEMCSVFETAGENPSGGESYKVRCVWRQKVVCSGDRHLEVSNA